LPLLLLLFDQYQELVCRHSKTLTAFLHVNLSSLGRNSNLLYYWPLESFNQFQWIHV
jgi:hypothetical protein